MANYASAYDGASLKSLMRTTSTKIQKLVSEMKEVQKVLSQIADNDLKAMIAAGEGLTLPGDQAAVDALFAQVRDWQFHVNQLADNYSGQGAVSDVSFHVAKRAIV